MDKSTDSCMTEKQWNKKGYVLKENAEGILGWQSCYYNYKFLIIKKLPTIKGQLK